MVDCKDEHQSSRQARTHNQLAPTKWGETQLLGKKPRCEEIKVLLDQFDLPEHEPASSHRRVTVKCPRPWGRQPALMLSDDPQIVLYQDGTTEPVQDRRIITEGWHGL